MWAQCWIRTRMNGKRLLPWWVPKWNFASFLCRVIFTLGYVIITRCKSLWDVKPFICSLDAIWQCMGCAAGMAAVQGGTAPCKSGELLCSGVSWAEIKSARCTWHGKKGQVRHFHQPGLNFTPNEGCVNALRSCSSRIFKIGVLGGWSQAPSGRWSNSCSLCPCPSSDVSL